MTNQEIVEMAWLNYSVVSFGTNTISETDFKNIFLMGLRATKDEMVNKESEIAAIDRQIDELLIKRFALKDKDKSPI